MRKYWYLYILKEEIFQAVKRAKNSRAAGPDKTGYIPKKWLVTSIFMLLKTSRSTTCNEYRPISLMSHTVKILLRVIQNRIQSKCEEHISKEQFGFRGGLGTREALFCINILIQKLREFQKPLYMFH